MKNTLIQLFGWCYVTYALLSAYCALNTLQASTTSVVRPRSYVQAVERVNGYDQRVDRPYSGTTVDISDEFFIEIWSSDDCPYCRQFEKRELPKFKKAGVRYKVFNTEMFPPPGEVKVVPCIRVLRQDKLIKQFNGYVKAEKVLEYVTEEVKLLT